MDDVTVVIPCFNEEKTIRALYERCLELGYEVLVPIAKRSSDNTKRVCEENQIPYFIDSGFGKGAAIRESLYHVKTSYSVFFDADGSHLIEDIKPLANELISKNADLVIASRLKGGSLELYDGSIESFFRTFFTLCINQIINTRFNSRITDTQNGFRAVKVESLKKLNLKSDRFEIETEEVMKLLKAGGKISEIPSMELERKHGSSGISIMKEGWRYVWTVFSNIF
ncbi:glycosyltransferase family 2 protein [Candidatus Micrarchaeota archaeon]|nr:glycosyltransferase family 2 protein [Candidatus Micrarchaeota archaeon]